MTYHPGPVGSWFNEDTPHSPGCGQDLRAGAGSFLRGAPYHVFSQAYAHRGGRRMIASGNLGGHADGQRSVTRNLALGGVSISTRGAARGLNW